MWPFDDEEEQTPVAPAAAPASPPAPMNDLVKSSLIQKYGLDKLGNDQRQKIVAENEEDRSGPAWAAALGALGAGIQGKDAISAGQNILNSQERQRQGRLESFDKNRMLAMQDADNDPNSPQSKTAQKIAEGMGVDKSVLPTLTAAQLREFSPAMSKRLDIEQRTLDRQEARDERRFLAGERSTERKEAKEAKEDEKMRSLQTPVGIANTVEDAKDIKAGLESKKNFDSKINEMIALREKHGGGASSILDSEDVERGQQLSKDLLLEYKNMAKLGVLSAADEKIINAIIPKDPLEFKPLGALSGQDPILANLKAFKADSDKDFKTKVSTRTREGLAGGDVNDLLKKAGIGVPPPEGGKKVVVDRKINPKAPGKVKLVYQDGSEEIVDSAVANNGK